jgi:PTS system nitrogen regulatory IIA component
MRLSDILAPERILVDLSGETVHDKADAIRLLSEMLAPVVSAEQQTVERLLMERERLQSTGIGDGVAIPHTSVESAPGQAAALLLSRRGIPFDAIDGADVHIIFGVVGPKRATGEHLRALARISRLLRDNDTRTRLVSANDARAAMSLIEENDASLR